MQIRHRKVQRAAGHFAFIQDSVLDLPVFEEAMKTSTTSNAKSVKTDVAPGPHLLFLFRLFVCGIHGPLLPLFPFSLFSVFFVAIVVAPCSLGSFEYASSGTVAPLHVGSVLLPASCMSSDST